MPSGPHGVGHFDRVVAERLGSAFHAIDLDPRWVKKVAARSEKRDNSEMAAYVHHVLEQATVRFETQDVGKPARDTAIGRGDHP